MSERRPLVSLSVLKSAMASEGFELAPAARREAGARRRIWEIIGASHCSIVGTCLTIAELRKIARRTGFLGEEARYNDYQVHGLFVEKMHDENIVSRAVQKHLDTRYEGAIRKAKALDGEEALLAYWESAVDNGFVPGAYWALIGHPRLTPGVETRIFGDIHMMSHLSGAAHRGDAREVAEARREKAEIARRLASVIAERNDELTVLRDEIARLGAQLREARTLAAECESLRREVDILRAAERSDETLRELAALRLSHAELREDHTRLERRLERTKAKETRAAPAPIVSEIAVAAAPIADEPRESETDLCGRCLLYVGGRPRTVCRLQRLVEQRNGSLIHHDGGVEDNRAMLSELVRRADAVFFPVDCVSHRAVGAVKSLCESHGIPYCPLRSASASAFERAIETLAAPVAEAQR
ncbi:hypothetical protein A1351_09570 [Methylosinus sp. R-45379]|uniref:DUF2325 domain-containing protein n=1 Tax=Methylosinus sp. R-45379 TaxID=980563 RepID=UPI0007C8F23E|nr:DUF2325 domain-containing protein [Methylosinus sp. R-45379]OAI30145.1 hypothetical protein A1351_09570 [Methylosinus sp. R-45379]